MAYLFQLNRHCLHDPQKKVGGLLTVVVQGELVENPPAWLLPDVLVNDVSAQLVQTNGVCERFT